MADPAFPTKNQSPYGPVLKAYIDGQIANLRADLTPEAPTGLRVTTDSVGFPDYLVWDLPESGPVPAKWEIRQDGLLREYANQPAGFVDVGPNQPVLFEVRAVGAMTSEAASLTYTWEVTGQAPEGATATAFFSYDAEYGELSLALALDGYGPGEFGARGFTYMLFMTTTDGYVVSGSNGGQFLDTDGKAVLTMSAYDGWWPDWTTELFAVIVPHGGSASYVLSSPYTDPAGEGFPPAPPGSSLPPGDD